MKNWFMNLTLAKKQMTVLLVVGLLPMLIVAWMALTKANSEMRNLVYNQLEAVRDIKSAAVVRYFASLESLLLSQAHLDFTQEAAHNFSQTFDQVIKDEQWQSTDITNRRNDLREYYQQEFAVEYQKRNNNKAVDAANLLAQLPDESMALQYFYIKHNAQKLGEKHLMETADGSASYHRWHTQYHHEFKTLLEKFGLYDIFLVDAETGRVVYSVFKELDYATSLKKGAYANTGLAEAFNKALTLQEGQTILVDFKTYTPSYDAPASFMATPLFKDGQVYSVYIYQVPLETVNAIMGERSGMGKTGESYLVGADYLMRSDSYLDAQNRTVVNSFKYPEKGSVKTQSAQWAIEGKKGTAVIDDYNHNAVLSAYAPVDILGLKWVSIAELDVQEAFAGIGALKVWLLIVGALIVVLIVVVSWLIARWMADPVLKLGQAIQQVQRSGKFISHIDNPFQDEIGQTSRAFSHLLNNVSDALNSTNHTLIALGKGDYSQKINKEYIGDLGLLSQGVNQAVDNVESAHKASQYQSELAKESALRAEVLAQEAQAQATRTLVIKQALDVSATSMMITNANFDIVYLNEAADLMMSETESDLKKTLPQFSAKQLLSSNIDVFHKNPSHQRELLKNLTSSYRTQLKISGLTFNLTATPIRNDKKEFLGAVVEWDNVTVKLAQEVQAKQVADENARIRQSLDSSSNSTMITDSEFNVIYMNQACQRMLERHQSDFNKMNNRFHFSAGSPLSLLELHPSPAQWRHELLNAQQSVTTPINPGQLTFQVTATPIVDAQQQRSGLVVEWLDRTSEVAIEKEIDQVINAAAEGSFSGKINQQGKTGFFLSVSEGLNRLMGTTQIALKDVLRVLGAMARGDLSQRIERDYSGELAQLKTDVNGTVEKLRSVIGEIREASDKIANGAYEMSSGTADLSARTEQQAASLEETASSMEEMTQTTHQAAESAQQVRAVASRAQQLAIEGDVSVKKSATAMTDIADASMKISNIIGIIDELAFQTNLLALNAAVEAARAGEQGRGFAVVAGEVRHLAQRSASAAKEIKGLIQESVNCVKGGTALVEESSKSLNSIVKEIATVSKMIEQISISSREQSSGIEQVNTAVSQMDKMTQQNAALVEEASAASATMADQAKHMDDLMQFFKT